MLATDRVFDEVHAGHVALVRSHLDAFDRRGWRIVPRPALDRGPALTVWLVTRPEAPARPAGWVFVGHVPTDMIDATPDVRDLGAALRALRRRWREAPRRVSPAIVRLFAAAVARLERVVPEAFG